jgi:hypothetical protein
VGPGSPQHRSRCRARASNVPLPRERILRIISIVGTGDEYLHVWGDESRRGSVVICQGRRGKIVSGTFSGAISAG